MYLEVSAKAFSLQIFLLTKTAVCDVESGGCRKNVGEDGSKVEANIAFNVMGLP